MSHWPVRFGRTFSIGRVNNWTVVQVWKMKVRDSVKGLYVRSFVPCFLHLGNWKESVVNGEKTREVKCLLV